MNAQALCLCLAVAGVAAAILMVWIYRRRDARGIVILPVRPLNRRGPRGGAR